MLIIISAFKVMLFDIP